MICSGQNAELARFDRTYEGLKRPLYCGFSRPPNCFDRTYEGLKHGLRRPTTRADF